MRFEFTFYINDEDGNPKQAGKLLGPKEFEDFVGPDLLKLLSKRQTQLEELTGLRTVIEPIELSYEDPGGKGGDKPISNSLGVGAKKQVGLFA